MSQALFRIKADRAAAATLQNLNAAEKQIATPRPQPKLVEKPKVILEEGLTSRESLDRKLSLLTSSMPLCDLELLVDIARSIRLRSMDA